MRNFLQICTGLNPGTENVCLGNGRPLCLKNGKFTPKSYSTKLVNQLLHKGHNRRVKRTRLASTDANLRAMLSISIIQLPQSPMAKDKIPFEGHFRAAYSLESKDETVAHYKTWAASYDREVGEENRYAQPVRTAQMLKRYLYEQDAPILDAGCGSGLSGTALKEAGYSNIDGCDFSPEMLAKAKEKQCYNKVFEADLNEGQPTIEDDTYDAVTCVGVFSFGHVSPDACDDLLRIVKSGGHIIIALNEQFWEKGDLAQKIAMLEQTGKIEVCAKEYGDHLPGHNVNGWVLALKKL